MAGRTNRIPRCPVCATMLSTDRTIEERLMRGIDPAPDYWVYRLACPQCLSVVRIVIPEINALARSDPSAPVVDVAGAVVARLRERLVAAEGPAAIAAVLADARSHPEHRVLLRIPEMLALARPVFAGGASLAEDLVLDWPALRDSSRPMGRLVLHRPARAVPQDNPVGVIGEALELRMYAGRDVTITGIEGGTLLLKPPRDAELLEWLSDVEVLVAWADFVVPRLADD